MRRKSSIPGLIGSLWGRSYVDGPRSWSNILFSECACVGRGRSVGMRWPYGSPRAYLGAELMNAVNAGSSASAAAISFDGLRRSAGLLLSDRDELLDRLRYAMEAVDGLQGAYAVCQQPEVVTQVSGDDLHFALRTEEHDGCVFDCIARPTDPEGSQPTGPIVSPKTRNGGTLAAGSPIQ